MDFDIKTGFYLSLVSNIETELHSHPAIELVFTKSPGLEVETINGRYRDIQLAIFNANELHRISVKNCDTTIFLIEYRDYSVRKILREYSIEINSEAFIKSDGAFEFDPEKLILDIINNSNSDEYDPRVVTAFDYIDKHDLVYTELIQSLASNIYLSESRLSHLFKKDTGVSLKKYLVWSRLKKTINYHLHKELDLYSAMIHSGFYDQAHFSKAYKKMIGINPSKVYKKQNVTKS